MNGSPFFIRCSVWSVILVAFTLIELNAQCDPPDLLPTVDCAQAPEVCLQDACYSTDNQVMTGHQGFCGNNTIINNPQYFVITATSTMIEIHIYVETPCTGGNGALQSAIINMVDPCDSWTNNDVLACNPGTPPGGTMVLQVNNAVPGTQYFLLIDGSNGAQCQYTIEFANGVYEPQIDEELDEIDPGFASVCQGQDELYIEVGPAITNAAGYIWYIPCLTPPEITTTNPELYLEIPDNAPLGNCEICVVGFSGCDTTETPVCMEIDIYEVDDEQSDPITICDEDLPYNWNNVIINGPGDYTATFNTPEGCPYDSMLTFDVYPIPEPGLIDTVHCGVDFFYEGEMYSSSGEYDLFYQDASVNGCDSTAMIDLTLNYIEFDIMMECQDQMFVLCPLIYAQEPNNALLYYEWYNGVGDLIGEDECVSVSAEDIYNLFIGVEVDGVRCDYEAFETFEVVHEGFYPEPPTFDEFATSVCGDLVTFSVEQESGVITWDWTAPSQTTILGNGFYQVEIDFSSSSGGLICVSATNDCGTGEENCIEVDVIAAPDASFDMTDVTCVDSTVVVEFTGSASGSAQLNWNFGDAEVLSGTGPGPYLISFPTQGTGYPITLQVIEPGCDTVSTTQLIDVENLVAPVINCESTIDSITFTWPDNGNIYSVNQLNGPPGTLVGTSYIIGGLNPSESVTIEVSATNNGPCGTITIPITCSANNCPNPGLALQTPDSLCLNEVSGTYMLTATAMGNPTMGSWSGPGIVNTMTGEFDPNDPSAGVGQHTIIFMYTDPAGCVSQTSQVINVFNAPTAAFQADPEACVGDIVNINYTGNGSMSANYTWNFDGGTVVSGSGQGPYQVMWNTGGTYTVILSVENNGCVSAQESVDVAVRPEIQPIVWDCAPQTDQLAISWTEDPNAVGYNVNYLFGGPCVELNGQIICDGLVPGDSVAIELIAMSSGICPDVRDTLYCVAKQCPPVTVAVDPVAPICLYPGTGTVDLNVTITNQNGGTGSWSGTGVIDVNNGIFDPVAAGPGTHNITYTYMEEGCPFPRTIMIQVNPPPVARIANQAYILNCDNNNMVTLDGSGSSPAANLMYSWSTQTGSIASGATTSTPVVTGEGTYKLVVTNSLTGCKDSTEVFVDQDDDVPTADAGENEVLNCDIEMVVLGGSSTTGNDIIYNWTTSNGSIVGSASGMTIEVDAPGTYTIEVTDTVSGCVSTDMAMVSLDDATPEPDASVDEILDCDTETVEVTGTTTLNLPSYVYNWSTSDGNIIGSANQEVITVDAPGTYVLVVRNSANGCLDSTSIDVMADPEVISNLELEYEGPSCFGDVDGMVAVATIQGGTAPYTYAWSPVSSTDSVLTNVPAGTYTVTVTDANGCTDVSQVTLDQPVDLSVDLGSNLFVNAGDTVVIIASPNIPPSEVSLYNWTGIYNAQCPTCDVISFEADQSGSITVEVIDVNGCITTESIVVDVNRPKFVFVPNVFSPNGDGVNDYFNIFANEEIAAIRDLKIFDRWGEMVHSQEVLDFNNETTGWDGRTNNKEILPGVYVYSALVEYTDGYEEVISGDITLVR